jgi:hypothetical protein
VCVCVNKSERVSARFYSTHSVPYRIIIFSPSESVRRTMTVNIMSRGDDDEQKKTNFAIAAAVTYLLFACRLKTYEVNAVNS